MYVLLHTDRMTCFNLKKAPLLKVGKFFSEYVANKAWQEVLVDADTLKMTNGNSLLLVKFADKKQNSCCVFIYGDLRKRKVRLAMHVSYHSFCTIYSEYFFQLSTFNRDTSFRVELVTWSITSWFGDTHTKRITKLCSPGERCNQQRWWSLTSNVIPTP